ncbi:MAG: phosphatidylserine decarboxylase [Alphaproteobacteria bacterium]|jgi:phosphatidylserine decarboxylase|nr:phosphatidylserine decarboxylase [Alphaproteobacteria bacterium]MDP6518183.1 phosphatidylserine decarboxylase [Alphaproteobacteria bacterium]
MHKGSPHSMLVPIHREGWRFVAVFVGATAGLWWLAAPLGWAGAALTLWCAYFFRDPARAVPPEPGVIVSPADGVVLPIEVAAPPAELDMGPALRRRISVFMNVFNVHVNRIPADGTVTALSYRPGKFFNASFDKASEHNERQSVRMSTAGGHDIAFVQIAGLVARRILCQLVPDQRVCAGERFGLIRFGSRVDLYLDDDMELMVRAGEHAIGGETILARERPAPGSGP